jgi:hypothetical protein
MRLSVVFGTRGNQQALPHLERILHCLEIQTFQDFQIIVVVDRKFSDDAEYQTFLSSLNLSPFSHNDRLQFFTNLNSDFVPHSKG